MERSISDAAIAELFEIVTEKKLPSASVSPQALKARAEAAIIAEVERSARDGLAAKLAKALDLPSGSGEIDDHSVARLYRVLLTE